MLEFYGIIENGLLKKKIQAFLNNGLLAFNNASHHQHSLSNYLQEKMRGQRGRLPVQPSGYVMSTKVIFRRAEVFVLAEVCLLKRPHAG